MSDEAKTEQQHDQRMELDCGEFLCVFGIKDGDHFIEFTAKEGHRCDQENLAGMTWLALHAALRRGAMFERARMQKALDTMLPSAKAAIAKRLSNVPTRIVRP